MGKGKRAYIAPTSSSDVQNALHQPAPTFISSKNSIIENGYVRSVKEHEEEEALPTFTLVTTYLSYFILIIYGHVRDFIDYFLVEAKKEKQGYAPINSGFDTFYHRRLYTRIRDVFNRPVTNVPGRHLDILERYSDDYNKTFKFTGKINKVLNLSSYNYLGFAQANGPCADAVELSVRKYGVGTASGRMESGSLDLHTQTEALVAKFLGQEDAILLSMGFATNSTTLPALVGKGDLIISDELNHSSLVYGARASRCSIRVFKHNDPKDLELVLRDAISQGQPRTHRPWKKILVVIEGLYSMEGDICKLPEIIELKRKYKFYIYLDEAHSIGALGPNGRGVCDYFGVDPSDIDILMGTFTKSYGAAGGYLAGRKNLMDSIRLNCHSSVYAESITPPVLTQIHSSMSIIMGTICGNEGRMRIATLAQNAKYFRDRLRDMGFIVYGNDSPVIPLLLFHPAKIPAFSRELLDRGIAVVVVGYPATAIITSRVRFCLSAAHTREDLDFALSIIDEVGDRLMLKVSQRKRPLQSKN